MDHKLQPIVDTLKELCVSSRLCDKTDSSIHELMHKYDMVFFGSDLNQINSIELCHYLSEKTDIVVTIDELNTLLPRICYALDMPLEPMQTFNDLHNPDPACYFITLWK